VEVVDVMVLSQNVNTSYSVW